MRITRFTLRDLFWLMLVCALAVSWWVGRASLAHEQDARRRYQGKFEKLVAVMEQRGWKIDSIEDDDFLRILEPLPDAVVIPHDPYRETPKDDATIKLDSLP